ncbi:unnamed protein product [Protopolystoma xenopodis]|uniref:Uncharacterized protein n=1 Tax=Protopolystoma xenopodis TaxID=117903 RepID=A0A448X739_9PLAT|nr:unnamed protein product [Protopolystoma xenopodis]
MKLVPMALPRSRVSCYAFVQTSRPPLTDYIHHSVNHAAVPPSRFLSVPGCRSTETRPLVLVGSWQGGHTDVAISPALQKSEAVNISLSLLVSPPRGAYGDWPVRRTVRVSSRAIHTAINTHTHL